MKTYFLIAVSALLFLVGARAELAWEQTELDLKPGLHDESVVGNFKYQNKGNTPVHINSVRTSCGCTTAALQKNDVAPGEKGEITATFKIGDRTGLQQKSVTVETNDPKQPTTVLVLKANIPIAIELKPSFIYWQGNELAKPKTIIATVAKELPVKNLEVTSSSPDFTAEVQPADSPGSFRINVQPKDTSKMVGATIAIKADPSANFAKIYYARAQVTAPTPASSPAH